MPINIGSVKGYYFLDVWIMANIIQLANYHFCRRFLNSANDPCGRMFDQMSMAARSCTANIAEGVSRHQTSRETEMKLLDVARASLSELLNDYFFWALAEKIEIWDRSSDQYKWVINVKINKPKYKDDWTREAQQHIISEYQRFQPVIENESIPVVINGMIILCNRTITMLQRFIEARLDEFKQTGGFTENLSRERLAKTVDNAVSEDNPKCPKCGKPMLLKTAKRVIRHFE